MPAGRRRPKASVNGTERLFGAAEKACRDLRLFIAGELELSDAQVQAKRGLIQKASKESFYFFAKVVLGYDKLTNETHKKWAKDFQDKFLKVRRLMRLKPRGTYKTTLYGIAGVLFVWAAYSTAIRIFYTSANETLLKEVAAEIDRHLRPESLYGFVFDIARDPKLSNTWDMFNIIGRGQGAGTSLMFRTAGGSTNGIHPHVVFIDDPMDKEDRTSDAVRVSKTRWLDSIRPLLVPFELTLSNGTKVQVENMVFIATRWHLQDLVDYALSKGKWDVESESVYKDDDGETPRYPEFLPLSTIDAIKAEIDENFFSCQYRNNPLPEGTKVFAEERLHFYHHLDMDTRGTNWAFFDPSKGGKKSDYPAAIWVHVYEGQRYFFDALDKKFGLDASLTMIVKRCGDTNTRGLVFETNGAMGLEQAIAAKCKELKVSLALYPIHESSNKEARIEASQPVLYRGDHKFRADWKTAYPEMMKQVFNYPIWRYDDYPDVIEKSVTWLEQNVPGSLPRGAAAAVQTFAGSMNRGRTW